MGAETRIAWTDKSLNLWLGCTKVSEGCKNCYAETFTRTRMGLKVWGLTADRKETKTPWQHVKTWERTAARGDTPGHYGRIGGGKTPHLIFLGSLMDWAEDRRDLDPLRVRMWDIIRTSPHLWFQMLTKRPENIAKFLPDDWGQGYRNVWLGTTIEDNRVKVRADHLRAIPARVHFISYEPAIGPLNEVDLTGIQWVIVGGESGPGFRPFDMQWARDVRDRCVKDRIAFFMKQGAARFTETNPFLEEPDGTRWAWKQYPGKLTPPRRMD